MSLLEAFADKTAADLPTKLQPLLNRLRAWQGTDQEVGQKVLQWLILVFSDRLFGLQNLVGSTNQAEAERLVSQMKCWHEGVEYPDRKEVAKFSRGLTIAHSEEKLGPPVIDGVRGDLQVRVYERGITSVQRENACWAMTASLSVVGMATVLPDGAGLTLHKLFSCAVKARAGFDQESFETEAERLLELLITCCLSGSHGR